MSYEPFEDQRLVNVLDLFSGIGGFTLGLERAGFSTVAFCETDDFCRRVLAHHWPNIPIHGDITYLNARPYRGTVDVVVGGFPCQPYSQAGKRGGSEDDRALWPEMLRVVEEVQPTWFVGENVTGLEHLALAECVSDLEGLGYAVQVFDIPACGIGASHRRHRIWIVAHADGAGVRIGAERSEGRRDDVQAGRQAELVYDGEAQSHPDSDYWRQRGEWLTEHGELECTRGDQSEGLGAPGRREGPADTDAGRELLEGREAGPAEVTVEWPTEPSVCGADDGIPDRVDRLRALGNAVVPAIVTIIGQAILAQGDDDVEKAIRA